MGKNRVSIQFLCMFFFYFSTLVRNSEAKVPALYVFGDSLFDPGNAAAKYPIVAPRLPYTIDLPKGVDAKYSNGRSTIDFLDEFLGLPNQPPIVPTEGKSVPSGFAYQGFNYAFAASGIIVNQAGVLKLYNLGEQVNSFRRTVKETLVPHFKSESDTAQHLSKSIFIVQIGLNDYGLSNLTHYLNIPSGVLELANLTPEGFADVLVRKLGQSLEDLHQLGARKFVVFELHPFDCFPVGMARIGGKDRCDNPNGTMPTFFNSKLASTLDRLRRKFVDSTFVIGKTYDFYNDLIKNPAHYGISDATNSCCKTGPPADLCESNSDPCSNRESYAFFDITHPTEATYKIVAQKCFNGTGFCVPMNIQQLADK